MRIPYTSVIFSARRTRKSRVIDLATADGARYFAAMHLDYASRATLEHVLADIEADSHAHTLPQSTDDLARNIRDKLALMTKFGR